MKSIFYTDGPIISLGVDSALHRPSEPLFLPDDTKGSAIVLVPAVRICRLGKCIPRNKAREYYDAVTVAAVFFPPDDFNVDFLEADDSLTPGAWLNPDELPEEVVSGIVGLDGRVIAEPVAWHPALTPDKIADAVYYSSRHMTLKTGDMLLFGDRFYRVESPKCDTVITADVDGTNILSLKLK